jgi:uncharacterized protein (TIGR00369 family)
MYMDLQEKIRSNFARQGLMQTLGAELADIAPGRVTIQCRYQPGLGQQHGFFHAGVLASLADSACGYAALTKMPENADVLSVEFKINLLKPAQTELIVATATVVQAGKRIVVCEAVVTDEAGATVYAKMMGTMIVVL